MSDRASHRVSGVSHVSTVSPPTNVAALIREASTPLSQCVAWANHLQRPSSPLRRLPGVVVVTSRDSEADVCNALQAGVGGYLLGSCGLNELEDAVRAVGRGSPYLCEVAASLVATSLTRTPLTMRESEILRLIGSGMSNKMVASELNIALGTVKAHVRTTLDKLGARSRTQAIVIAAQRGLLGPQSPLRLTAEPHSRPISMTPPLRQRRERVRVAARGGGLGRGIAIRTGPLRGRALPDRLRST
jgi:DNA-binding NarL/FixJ family response regulator